MSVDANLKRILETVVSQACDKVNAAKETYKVRFMGRVKKEKSLLHGWYVPVQNFDDLSAVKRSGSKDYYRYYFRIVQRKETDSPMLEISKWTSSNSSVEDYETYFEQPYPEGLSAFKEELKRTILASGIDLD